MKAEVFDFGKFGFVDLRTIDGVAKKEISPDGGHTINLPSRRDLEEMVYSKVPTGYEHITNFPGTIYDALPRAKTLQRQGGWDDVCIIDEANDQSGKTLEGYVAIYGFERKRMW